MVLAARTSLAFIFFSQTLALFSPLYPLLRLPFYLKVSGGSGRNYLLSPPLLPDWIPGHSFLLHNDAEDELAWRCALLLPSAIPVASLLLPLVSTFFLGLDRTVSSKFSDSQVPSASTKELVPPCHARCVFSRFSCNGNSFLLSSYLDGIENPSCSAYGHLTQDTSHLILRCYGLCTARSLATLCFSNISSLQALGSFPASGALCFFALLPFLGKGQITAATTVISKTLKMVLRDHLLGT